MRIFVYFSKCLFWFQRDQTISALYCLSFESIKNCFVDWWALPDFIGIFCTKPDLKSIFKRSCQASWGQIFYQHPWWCFVCVTTIYMQRANDCMFHICSQTSANFKTHFSKKKEGVGLISITEKRAFFVINQLHIHRLWTALSAGGNKSCHLCWSTVWHFPPLTSV